MEEQRLRTVLRKRQTSWTWGVASFDKAKLKKMETQRKNTLPTKETTEQEKQRLRASHHNPEPGAAENNISRSIVSVVFLLRFTLVGGMGSCTGDQSNQNVLPVLEPELSEHALCRAESATGIRHTCSPVLVTPTHLQLLPSGSLDSRQTAKPTSSLYPQTRAEQAIDSELEKPQGEKMKWINHSLLLDKKRE
uniref:Thymosin beta-10 n=1 Tax=Molossus molossus TaxID=27622 RepID=A0A7J8HJ32_MOLMO|nr:hypothetical protein HJG59_011051 [Molossus molossus]